MTFSSSCQYLLLTVVFLWGFNNGANAQFKSVTGTITTDSGQVLQAASINLINDKSTILSFAISGNKGTYTLTVPVSSAADSLSLEVSYIGYKKQRRPLIPGQYVYDFRLSADTGTLNNVLIRNRPAIQSLGDTIRYYVNNFARPEDRSIGDVLRRMPGISVDVDGTIYHNGKKVENLYIQGDDLMDGRYGLAPKIISKDLINSVDIIQNHQPIEVLKNKEQSDKTAINLVLKNEKSLKLSTKAMAGGGFPSLYDCSLNPILLSERIKMINTIAFNNSGVDYKNDFRQLGATSLVSTITQEPPGITLSLGTVSPPDLPLANYYFNRSGIANLNNLYKTKKGLQLKTNLQVYIDRNTWNYFNRTDNYLPADTITFSETQRFTSKPFLFNGAVSMQVNKEKYFFNNTLRISLSNYRDNSELNFNGSGFEQQLTKKPREFSNDLSWIPAFRGKGIGELRWLISYSTNRQLLDIGSGYFSPVPGQQGNFDHVIQTMDLPTFYSHTYLSYRLHGSSINQEYKAGITIQTQTLESLLSFTKNGLTTPYASDPGNDLDWNKRTIYTSANYQFRKKKTSMTLKLPLNFQHINYSQNGYQPDGLQNNIIFTPEFSTRYDITPEKNITARYRMGNTFGTSSNVFRGALLQNYRLLQANDAALQQRNSHSAALNYEYQKSIVMLFLNLGLSWDKTISNSILSSDVSGNLFRTILLPYRNTQTNTALNMIFSKYIFRLKTTLSVKSQLSRFRFKQLINNQFLPFYSDMLYLNASLLKKISGAVSINYQPMYLWNLSKADDKNTAIPLNYTNRSLRFEQSLAVSFTAKKKLLVEINGRHSISNQTGSKDVQYFFLDSKMRVTNTGKKIDLGLELNNIFNVKSYIRYLINSNQLLQDEYTIRGRMAVLRLDYYF